MSWTEIPDVRTLAIYGLLTLASGWVVARMIGAVIQSRRDRARWEAEDAALQASLDVALRELDDERRRSVTEAERE